MNNSTATATYLPTTCSKCGSLSRDRVSGSTLCTECYETPAAHEFATDDATFVDGIERVCDECGYELDAPCHDDPAEALPQSMKDAAQEALSALMALASEMRQMRDRDSENVLVRRFSAYHLADCEGNEGGAGWLASNLLADALRDLLRGRL